MRLEAKVAFVTGGGSGIGRATVRRFVEEGAIVVAADRNEDGLAETLAGLPADQAWSVRVDVADSATVDAAFADVRDRHGRLDVLVNAAGIGSASQPSGARGSAQAVRNHEAARRGETPFPKWDFTVHITDEEFQNVIAVNLMGPFYALRAAIPLFMEAGGGAVVNISSVSALVGHPLPVYYPASKAGLLGLTRAAAGELADRGIRVNAVCPGATDTPMFRGNPEGITDILLGLQPIPRAASPEEMASTVLFLASDESAFYTGQTLSPNGGMWM
jgi:NAD(P)-dependent dehydrogenase (short-subunit alcohol dehydrogenase family)